MVTPASTAAVPSPKPSASRSLRALVLWSVFAAVLTTGLVFAARFGASAPVMIDGMLR